MKRSGSDIKIKKRNLIPMLVFCLIFVAAVSYIVYYGVTAYRDREEQRQLAAAVSAGVKKEEPGSNIIESSRESHQAENLQQPTVLPEYRELYSRNNDMIGWVSIDGTNINYPVMFTPNDPEYYLHRDFEKNYLKSGLPFLDGGTVLGKSSNYIIYGHNMTDGTAFSDLQKYCDENFYKQHKIIHFNTLYSKNDYEIIGVMLSKVYNQSDNVFKYYTFNFPADEKQYADFVEQVIEHSMYDTGVSSEPGEQLITLSTCSYHTKDGRLAVVAKQVS